MIHRRRTHEISYDVPYFDGNVVDYHTRGVIPVYRGSDPPVPRVRGFPYKRSQIPDVIPASPKDYQRGRIDLRSKNTGAEYDKIISAPATPQTKKRPRRTLSTEVRLISGVRIIGDILTNIHDYTACPNQTLQEIEPRVLFNGRYFPDFPRMGAKLDVDEASRRVDTSPDRAVILRTKFACGELCLKNDIISIRIAFPFGRPSSPGYLHAFALLVAIMRCHHMPASPLAGHLTFPARNFGGDAFIVEVNLALSPPKHR